MTPDELTRRAAAVNNAIAERDAAIIEAANEDLPQSVVADATGLTTERIRQIERGAGLPPRRPGRRGRPDTD